MNREYARRVAALEVLARPVDPLPVRYLFDALPPMSAAVAERYEAWLATVTDDLIVPGTNDVERAFWIFATVPHDMAMTANACAALLVEAYWHRDRDRHGESYAYKHQRNRDVLARQLEPLFGEVPS